MIEGCGPCLFSVVGPTPAYDLQLGRITENLIRSRGFKLHSGHEYMSAVSITLCTCKH
jgi:hypothetical protein